MHKGLSPREEEKKNTLLANSDGSKMKFLLIVFFNYQHGALEAKISKYCVSIHLKLFLKKCFFCHGFRKNMAFGMMNNLKKSGPTNLEVNFGYLVHLVIVVLTY